MIEHPEWNDITLQRCVDGELSEPEQQALLCQMEQSPQGWRTLALAFVEHQLWAQAGREWVNRPVVGPVLVTPVSQRKNSWARTAVLAASTLFAVGLGYLGGNWSLRDGRESPVPGLAGNPGSISTVAPLVPVSAVEPDSLSPVMMVDWIPEEGASPVRMPVYDAATVQRLGRQLVPRLPESTRQQLEELGIQVNEEPLYVPVPIETHRNLVMPVNTVKLRQQLH